MNKKILITIGVIAVVVLALWNLPFPGKPTQSYSQNQTQSQNTTGNNSGWATVSDNINRVSFQYPKSIGTKYISPTDWPPKMQVVSQQFVCTEAGSESAPAGITSRATINGHLYCVTRESGGAAGSIYTSYAYARQIAPMKIAVLTFSLRFVQCGNYPDSQMKQCQTERDNFSIDPTVDRIFGTLALQ